MGIVGPPEAPSILEVVHFTVFISKLMTRTLIYFRNALS